MSKFILHANDKNRANILANAVSFLHQLPDNKPWELTIEPHKREYTGKQRRSIFGPAYKAMMDFSGLEGDEEKKELHRFWCMEFFGRKQTEFGERPVRTTMRDENGKKNPISTAEAVRFYEFLQRKGAEVGCYIDPPDPFWREKAREEAGAHEKR